ncbi:hypothetical protein, partial [Limosilactobacillus fastidiosus]
SATSAAAQKASDLTAAIEALSQNNTSEAAASLSAAASSNTDFANINNQINNLVPILDKTSTSSPIGVAQSIANQASALAGIGEAASVFTKKEGLAAAQILLFEVQVAAAKETITSAASAASSAQIAASS